MQNDEMIFILIFLVSVLLSSISQVLLKKSTQKKYASVIGEYINPLVIFAYFLFFLCTFITIVAYKKVPLSVGPILESTSYIFINIFGFVFLKEKLVKRKLVGMIFIIVGIIIFSL